MSKINRSLHERFNRNHSPKCVTWEGANTTHKITCFDPTRSIRRVNDITVIHIQIVRAVSFSFAGLYSEALLFTDNIIISLLTE